MILFEYTSLVSAVIDSRLRGNDKMGSEKFITKVNPFSFPRSLTTQATFHTLDETIPNYNQFYFRTTSFPSGEEVSSEPEERKKENIRYFLTRNISDNYYKIPNESI